MILRKDRCASVTVTCRRRQVLCHTTYLRFWSLGILNFLKLELFFKCWWWRWPGLFHWTWQWTCTRRLLMLARQISRCRCDTACGQLCVFVILQGGICWIQKHCWIPYSFPFLSSWLIRTGSIKGARRQKGPNNLPDLRWTLFTMTFPSLWAMWKGVKSYNTLIVY